MEKIAVKPHREHLERLTKATPLISGIAELIWNSLDASATSINIKYKDNGLGGFELISLDDNGLGMSYDEAIEAFKNIGGSAKKNKTLTEFHGRTIHGSEGKGRYKALAIGNLVTFYSVFKDKNDNAIKKKFEITLNKNDLVNYGLSELKICEDQSQATGVFIEIKNSSNTLSLFDDINISALEEMFVVYHSTYPNFNVSINSKTLDFESHIKLKYPSEPYFSFLNFEGKDYKFEFKIIEWNKSDKTKKAKVGKKLNFCNEAGATFYQDNIGVQTDRLLSVYVMSDFISNIHKKGTLSTLNEDVLKIKNEAEKFLRNFIDEEKRNRRRIFIESLKKENIYPYKEKPKDKVEEAERELFDVIAVKINESVPRFENQSSASKKLLFSLISQNMGDKAKELSNILKEVCTLKKDELSQFDELLTKVTLPNMICTTRNIINRWDFIQELRELVYGDINSKIKERSQLHKIIEQNTWIFGEQYKPGESDKSLKTVLKSYISILGRDELMPEMQDNPDKDLNLIPDLCLWNIVPKGYEGMSEHLFVELKRPTVKAKRSEYFQIFDYAKAVAKHSSFSKDKTKWKFILVVGEISNELQGLCNQNKVKGMVSDGSTDNGEKENYEVYIYEWNHFIELQEGNLRDLRERLDYTMQSEPSELKYLKDVYTEFIPQEVGSK